MTDSHGEVVRIEVADSLKTLNIDESAPVVGDLFPQLDAPIPSSSSSPPALSSSSSSSVAPSIEDAPIDSRVIDELIRQHSKDPNFRKELFTSTDRLFFTKLYKNGELEENELTDFEKYNKEVIFETLLREKFMSRLGNNDLKTTTDLDRDYIPGADKLSIKPHRKSILEKLFMRMKPQQQFTSRSEFDDSMRTSIIDDHYIQPDDKNIPSSVYTTQRKLKSRHLQMIGFSSTIGVGLFLNSGKAFEIAGPLGCLLGYIIGGVIVLCTMLSFCEMVTLIPLSDGISGVTSRFIDDAFGFSLGLCYWISFGLGLPTEIIAGTIMLSYYTYLDVPDGNGTIGWIFLFLVLVILINLMDVRVYAEFEFFLNIIKILFTIAIIIFLIVSNRGGAAPEHKFVGFKYWNSAKSTGELTFGPFRPTFDLSDKGSGSENGIPGSTGRFLSVLTASLISCYSYNGTEIPCIVAGEVINPRSALKSASKQVFWRISFFYILSIFIIGISIYSGDPRLLRYMSNESGIMQGVKINENSVIKQVGGLKCYNSEIWNNHNNGNQSPWVLAIQYTNNCSLASTLNGLIIVFAISTSSSHLYVSSRSLYAMAVQGKAPKFLKKCWSNGVPYASILTTSVLGLLSFLALNDRDLIIFQVLINLISTSAILTWFGINFAYLRFFYALKQRADIVSRNDPLYPYKSPLQPLTAYVGAIGSFIILLLMGFVTFLKKHWSTEFFLTSYGMWILFAISYITYKYIRNVKFPKLYNIDLDTGRMDYDEIT